MTEADKNRLEKLRWESERKRKQIQLNEKLKQFLDVHHFDFLTFEESDNIQLSCDPWPDNKWSDLLLFQATFQDKIEIQKIVDRYADSNKSDHVFVFFMNFNFGLVRFSNSTLKMHWEDFIELDNDKIFCYRPNERSFICIEKTEDIIVGNKESNRQWIYEITFSNQNIKDDLT